MVTHIPGVYIFVFLLIFDTTDYSISYLSLQINICLFPFIVILTYQIQLQIFQIMNFTLLLS